MIARNRVASAMTLTMLRIPAILQSRETSRIDFTSRLRLRLDLLQRSYTEKAGIEMPPSIAGEFMVTFSTDASGLRSLRWVEVLATLCAMQAELAKLRVVVNSMPVWPTSTCAGQYRYG